MMGIQDLIDVQFQDLTGYADNDNSDVLGTLFANYWGPTTEIPMVYNRQTFFQAFPEVVPYNPDGAYHSIREYMSIYALRSYGQIKKAFDLGMGSAEIKNVNSLKRFVVYSNGVTSWQADQSVAGLNWAIALKYKGLIPSSLVGNGSGVLMFKVVPDAEVSGGLFVYVGLGTLEDTTPVLDVDNDVILESFRGSLIPDAVKDGENIYLGNVLQSSQFLTFFASDSWDGSFTSLATSTVQYTIPDGSDKVCTLPLDLSTTEMDFFSDITRSHTTLLINPFSIMESGDASVATSFDSTIQLLASKSATMNCVLGLHTTELPNTWINNSSYKFCLKVEGLEYVDVFGVRVILNCVGGWCGATARVAQDVRLNQLASAQTYGGYNGVLAKTQTFDKVMEAHKKGVISVYATNNGPQIFGVRAFLSNQNTYFAKANVMRVLASYLKNLIPLAMSAIHTDSSANPVTRRVLSSQMNSVCDEFIGNQNMKPGSYVDISDSLNNDFDTKGGEYLIILCVCRFIKLVEEVKFKIIATDSSVNVEFV